MNLKIDVIKKIKKSNFMHLNKALIVKPRSSQTERMCCRTIFPACFAETPDRNGMRTHALSATVTRAL
jgi:hypothetical protein